MCRIMAFVGSPAGGREVVDGNVVVNDSESEAPRRTCALFCNADEQDWLDCNSPPENPMSPIRQYLTFETQGDRLTRLGYGFDFTGHSDGTVADRLITATQRHQEDLAVFMNGAGNGLFGDIETVIRALCSKLEPGTERENVRELCEVQGRPCELTKCPELIEAVKACNRMADAPC